jgi:hypothetical protein
MWMGLLDTNINDTIGGELHLRLFHSTLFFATVELPLDLQSDELATCGVLESRSVALESA